MLATVSCRIELRCSQSVKGELGLTEWLLIGGMTT